MERKWQTVVEDTCDRCKSTSDSSGCRRICLYGLIPGGAYRNREFAAKSGYISTAELWREDLVFDPQTSGGLLAAVPADEAEEILLELSESALSCAMIGEVTDRENHALEIR